MSFEKLSKQDLTDIAAQYAVEVGGKGNKSDIIEALEAEGVTYELYSAVKDGVAASNGEDNDDTNSSSDEPAAAEKPREFAPGEEVIVYYTGLTSYSGPAVKVDAKNPFAVLSPEVADALLARKPGLFREANRRELEKFYS